MLSYSNKTKQHAKFQQTLLLESIEMTNRDFAYKETTQKEEIDETISCLRVLSRYPETVSRYAGFF